MFVFRKISVFLRYNITIMETNEIVESLTGKDVKIISDEVGCSKSTVYKYLSGDIPDNGIGKRTYEEIMTAAKTIILNRGNELIKIASDI